MVTNLTKRERRERKERRERRKTVPEGFQVHAAEPDALDKTLILGSTIYMRWETYGWQLGKITDVITDATPHLFKKINFRLVWADKSKQGAGQSKRSELCIQSRRGSTHW